MLLSWVAPRATSVLHNTERGTARMADSVSPMIVGRIIMPRIRDAVSILLPFPPIVPKLRARDSRISGTNYHQAEETIDNRRDSRQKFCRGF